VNETRYQRGQLAHDITYHSIRLVTLAQYLTVLGEGILVNGTHDVAMMIKDQVTMEIIVIL